MPKFKPRIIEDIIKGNSNIGRIAGINIKPVDFNNPKQSKLYIHNLLKIKNSEDTKIYIEGSKNIPIEFLDSLEEITGIKFNSGDNIKMQNIPRIIQRIYVSLGKEYNSTDTLIISNNKQKVIDTVKCLSDTILFFTTMGLESLHKDEIYDEILECTGVSIFQPNSIERIIKNYGTIINYNDDIEFEIDNIRNQALILDFSRKKPLKQLEGSKKRIIYIEDINFKLSGFNESMGMYASSELLECLGVDDADMFSQIYTNNNYYFIEDFIKSNIKNGGRI